MEDIYFEDDNASLKITRKINQFLRLKLDKKASILNLGEDSSLNKVLGPLVGTFLQEKNIQLKIYGTLENQIREENLKEILFPVIVVMPKEAKKRENIGKIIVKEGINGLEIKPNKPYNSITIIGLIGNKESGNSFRRIKKMAEVITDGLIELAIEYLYIDSYFNPSKKREIKKVTNLLEYKINKNPTGYL